MMALSSANPYPIVRIGDGSSNDKRFVKEINERDSYMENELNPRFLRTYELDAFFPEDWKLTVAVWDKGLVEFADKLIGQTVIDLENRLFSN
jgi:C2 domain